MLGFSKATEILLSEKYIPAKEAIRLGIVNEVVPANELNQAALKVAQGFARKPAKTLEGVKRLLNFYMRDLKDYLEMENQVLLKIVESSDFSKSLGEYMEEDK